MNNNNNNTKYNMEHDSTPERIANLLDLVSSKSEQILKADPCYEYRKTVAWAKKKGFIKDIPKEELKERLKTKPWLEVNKVIRANEESNED